MQSVVDKWSEGLWPALQALLKELGGGAAAAAPANGHAATAAAPVPVAVAAAATAARAPAHGPFPYVSPDTPVEGPAPLPPCHISIRFLDTTAASVDEAGAVPATTAADGDYSLEHPFAAVVSDCRLLTAAGSDRKVLHLELDISGSGERLIPGGRGSPSLSLSPGHAPDSTHLSPTFFFL